MSKEAEKAADKRHRLLKEAKWKAEDLAETDPELSQMILDLREEVYHMIVAFQHLSGKYEKIREIVK